MRDSDITMLYKVAKRYYIDGRLQNEIAREMGISRSMVSKLLTRAREQGLVKIEILLPEAADAGAAASELRDALGLDRVFVLPGSASGEDAEQISSLAMQAAGLMPALLEGSVCVGVGWGRTLYRLADELPLCGPHPKMTFAPLLGNSGLYNRNLQTSAIANRFADRFCARAFYLNVSPRTEGEAALSDYERMSFAELRALWDSMDAAVFSLSPSSVVENYYLAEYGGTALPEFYIDPAACGEMLSQAFFKNGSYAPFGTGHRLISFPLSRLREVRQSICIAVGGNKAQALVYAAKNGFYKTLITDLPTAGRMIEQLQG